MVFVLSASGAVKQPLTINASDLLHRSEYQLRGKTLEAKLELTVVRGAQKRILKFNLWSEGMTKATVKVTAPTKDRAVAHLRLQDRMWRYDPTIERVISIAPSMMKQSWMGADFTNGDLVRNVNLSRHYDHRLVAEETIQVQGTSYRTLKIECTPKKEAIVARGKVNVWIDVENAIQLRHEYFNEKGALERTLFFQDVKKFGDHKLGATLIVRPVGSPKNYTKVEYKEVKFDQDIESSIFTQEFLRKRLQLP